MKHIKNIIALAMTVVLVFGCKDFDELESNPNKPISVPASLALNYVLTNIYEAPWSLEHRQNQYFCCNYNYYGTNEYWSSATLSYLVLKNVVKMEEEALKVGLPEVNAYSAVGKFLRAVFFTRMTQRVGDVPLNEALLGIENTFPAYDTQKDVYIQILAWLEEANAEMANLIAASDKSLTGDFFFDNDLHKWQKVVNTFKLRVLMSLSKKADDADLNVKAKFKAVIDDPSKYPIMTSLADNMEYKFNGTSNLYTTNPGNRGFDKGRYNMAATLLGTLSTLKDPRVYVAANPAKKKLADGLAPTDFAAYVGAPSGESLDVMTFKAGNGEYSFANQKRYYTTFAGPEPTIQIGYPELAFTIAEAINRGWVAGDAAAYYENGIKASMKFYGIEDGSTLDITESDADEVIATVTVSVSDYLEQASVLYAGDNANGLAQILTQKYLAFFQNSGQEAYFNYRRTGIPTFDIGPGTGNNQQIPKRWLYPVAEATNNVDNYNAALQRQFGSVTDNLNADLWSEKN